MPLSAMHQKVRTSTVSGHQRQHQYIYHHCQLGHVIPGHAILVAVCIFMLPMLEVAAGHKQLTTTHHSNPADLCGGHVTFSDSPLVLPSLNNTLPAMALQNRVAWSNIHQSHSLSHSSIHHVSLKLGLSVSCCLKVVGRVVVLLLLLSGDIETNPGPDGSELTLDDVGRVLEEIVDLSAQWYLLGLQLKVKIGTLDNIRVQFADPKHQLLEMLKAWLTTSDNTTWEILTNGLRSQSVGASQLAGELEKKYYLLKKAEVSKEIPTQEDKGRYCAAAPAITSEIPTVSTATCSSNDCTSPPQSEGSQKTPFGCGCGKCTLFSLIERGCPRPIPSASSFPYLDLSRLTHEQQQVLRGRLQSESQNMMRKFQKLISATIKSLDRQNVSPDKLLCHVMAMGSLKPVFEKPQVPALHHFYNELKAAKTVYESFLVLKDYFSFFNYHIIEHIIEELGTEDDKAKLQEYKEDFNQYAKRRIFECLPEFGPISDIDHADVFVKVDSQYETYTVEEIEMFRHKLSEILRVSFQGILRLCRIDKGCFQLMFQVPSLVQQEIFPLFREQEKALAAMGVTKLTCGEYQFADDAVQEQSQHDIGVIVDEVEDFEPVQKKPRLDSDTEHDVEVIEFEFARKKPRLDTDRDSAMGLSVFTSGKSTTLSEDPLDRELEELDYELRVQGITDTSSFDKSGSGLELHRASAMGQLEYVRFLAEKKHYNPNQHVHGITAIHMAALSGNLEIFKYFITEWNCNPACPGPFGLTPLHLASELGHLDVVKYLVIEQQMDPLCEDEYGNTALHRACAGGCQAVVEFLTSEIRKYIPTTECASYLKNRWNSTPLHTAALNGHLDIVQFFTSDLDCDPNISGQHGGTPLHYAAHGGHLHIVTYLTNKQDSNPSSLDDKKLTHATMKRHMNIVKFLNLEKHCDPMCRDFKQNTPLHMAALGGHLEVVKFFASEMHCDPTSRNADNDTALHLAVSKGHLNVINYFICGLNCDPNIPGKYSGTPLHYAAEFGHLHIVKYLTDEHNCNPSSCLDEVKYTPLHRAAMNGHTDIVKFLTEEKQCDPMCRDSDQNTPLHMAALGGHIELVKFLTLEMHCDPTSRNADNDTALHLAVVNGHLDIVQFFYTSDQNYDSNTPGGQYSGTPLHNAAECGHLHIVKYLTDEQGCNPSSCLDENMLTPLHRAAMKGHMDIVKFLTVTKQCHPMCRDFEQNTPLHRAALGGHIEVVKFLTVEMHCDPTSRNANNDTALHLAVAKGHLDIVQFFISDQNCDLNMPGQYGRTPLHTAAVFGHLQIVKYLTEEQGCNPSCTLSFTMYAPLDWAAISGHLDIVKFLTIEKHCDPMHRDFEECVPLHQAAYNGHTEIVKFLTVEMNCDPMCRDCDWNTPLHVAAIKDHVEVVKFLTVKMYCDTKCKNANSHTALHLAAMKGHLDTLKFFISDQNCDPNIPGQYGRTPLHYAAEFGHLHIVKYLVDKQGCNPSFLDENKDAPLHRAAMKGHTDIVKFLTVEKNCNPVSQNFNGNTALHNAVLGDHLEVVKFFVEELKCPPDITGQLSVNPLQLAMDKNRSDIAQYLQKQCHSTYTAIAGMKDTSLSMLN